MYKLGYFIYLYEGDISIFGKFYNTTDRNVALQQLINESIFDKDLRDRISKASRVEIVECK